MAAQNDDEQLSKIKLSEIIAAITSMENKDEGSEEENEININIKVV